MRLDKKEHKEREERQPPARKRKRQTETKSTGAVSSLVLVAATSPSSSASTTSVDRRAYFAELQVQLSSCLSYKVMKRVVPDQLPYKFILNTPSSPALPTDQMSVTLLACIANVTRRILAKSKYRSMKTNYLEH